MYKQFLRWVGEFDTFLFKTFVNSEVDCLLNIHIDVVIRRQHIVDRFKHQGGVAELLKVGAIKSSLGLLFNTLANNLRD